jgi:LysM repeat protein
MSTFEWATEHRMIKRNKRPKLNVVSVTAATVLLVITFALIGFVALSVLTGNDFSLGPNRAFESPTPGPAATPLISLAGTPDPSALSGFSSTALGFGLKYPKAWQRKQKGLQVILSPSAAGLDADNLQDAAIWFGIPADNTTDTDDLLTNIRTDLSPAGQTLNRDTMIIGAQVWQLARVRFNHQPFDGLATAMVATTNRNGVGYYAVAMAPEEQWSSVEPRFQTILDSFHFTSEAVLRPTDATPPPTPTPTPTPVIYVVQSGDTLLKISLQYGVDVEALATRNGIDDPRNLRTGTKLIIPIKRR